MSDRIINIVISKADGKERNIFNKLSAIDNLVLITTTDVAKSYAADAKVVAVESFELHHLLDAVRGLQQDAQIHSLISSSEPLVEVCAKIRKVLHIQGQSEASAIAFRQKDIMKDYLKTAKTFRVPAYWQPGSGVKVTDYFSANQPVIVKPVDGSSSIGVTKYDSIVEAGKIPDNYIVEEYIDLPMLHVDGVIKDGQVVFRSVSTYSSNCLCFENKEILSSDTVEDAVLDRRIDAALLEIFSLLPTPYNSAFHLEMFYSDETLVFCEIASRAGGGYIVRANQEAYGVDISKEGMLAQAGACTLTAQPKKTKHTRFYLIPYGYTVDESRLQAIDGVVDYNISDQDQTKSTSSVDMQVSVLLANADAAQFTVNSSILEQEILA